jgi:hypothetical protein
VEDLRDRWGRAEAVRKRSYVWVWALAAGVFALLNLIVFLGADRTPLRALSTVALIALTAWLLRFAQRYPR